MCIYWISFIPPDIKVAYPDSQITFTNTHNTLPSFVKFISPILIHNHLVISSAEDPICYSFIIFVICKKILNIKQPLFSLPRNYRVTSNSRFIILEDATINRITHLLTQIILIRTMRTDIEISNQSFSYLLAC